MSIICRFFGHKWSQWIKYMDWQRRCNRCLGAQFGGRGKRVNYKGIVGV